MVEQGKNNASDGLGVKEGLRKNLLQASIEIFPSPTIGERVVNAFGGSGMTVNVTSSSQYGIDSTVNVSSLLARNGLKVIPHIGAQEIKDENHLRDVMRQIKELKIDEIFLVRGDGKQKGKYKTSAHLMRDLTKTEIELRAIGIAGYPEGISGMTNQQLLSGIQTREGIAKVIGAELYIVTQMCFDSSKIAKYQDELRDNNIDSPVLIGLPIPEKVKKLYEIAERCRVGDSKKFLFSKPQESEFQPQELVYDLSNSNGNTEFYKFHVYTFNKIKRLVNWYKELIQCYTLK